LALADIPPRLLVIGGGYIGLELGQVYAALGSSVSVVEMMPSLLPGVDQELVQPLARQLGRQFESIMLETRVVGMEETANGITVRFDGKNAVAPETTFDKVLVAVGRKPETGSLGIEHTAVEVGADGFFQTDDQKRTADPAIYAIGDAAGQPMLAHKGTAEARVAVEAIAGKKTVFDPAAIPAVVFTDPEIAWCGLTEEQARQAGLDVSVSRFPWAASGRALAMGSTAGLTKLVADADGRILGVGLAGHGAGELIAEGVMAIEMGAVAEDLALTVHAHPTLSETMMEAAELFTGRSVHFVGRG
ncbi:MAG: dihydrolipoyl dehydrogenase, partial [Lentisphaerae bacterium]|nr:dihydrolipoyl dehydrogenase [Lentisphaerota bacterium]